MTEQTEREALLPCPCCSSAARFCEILDPDHIDHGAQYIECTNYACGITTQLRWSSMDDCKPMLAETWNERSALQGLVGLVDLVLGRTDLPPAVREALYTNHRIAEARRCILSLEP